MARKKKNDNENQEAMKVADVFEQQQVEKEKIEEANKLEADDEQLKLAYAEIMRLKKSNAGLRGENSRLRSDLKDCESKLDNLNQLTIDLDEKIDEFYEQVDKLQQQVEYYKNLPWYKRICRK